MWDEGEDQDPSPHFGGGFGTMRAMLPMWGLGAKKEVQKLTPKLKKVELWFWHHSIRLEKTNNLEKITSKSDEKWPSYVH